MPQAGGPAGEDRRPPPARLLPARPRLSATCGSPCKPAESRGSAHGKRGIGGASGRWRGRLGGPSGGRRRPSAGAGADVQTRRMAGQPVAVPSKSPVMHLRQCAHSFTHVCACYVVLPPRSPSVIACPQLFGRTAFTYVCAAIQGKRSSNLHCSMNPSRSTHPDPLPPAAVPHDRAGGSPCHLPRPAPPHAQALAGLRLRPPVRLQPTGGAGGRALAAGQACKGASGRCAGVRVCFWWLFDQVHPAACFLPGPVCPSGFDSRLQKYDQVCASPSSSSQTKRQGSADRLGDVLRLPGEQLHFSYHMGSSTSVSIEVRPLCGRPPGFMAFEAVTDFPHTCCPGMLCAMSWFVMVCCAPFSINCTRRHAGQGDSRLPQLSGCRMLRNTFSSSFHCTSLVFASRRSRRRLPPLTQWLLPGWAAARLLPACATPTPAPCSAAAVASQGETWARAAPGAPRRVLRRGETSRGTWRAGGTAPAWVRGGLLAFGCLGG